MSGAPRTSDTFGKRKPSVVANSASEPAPGQAKCRLIAVRDSHHSIATSESGHESPRHPPLPLEPKRREKPSRLPEPCPVLMFWRGLGAGAGRIVTRTVLAANGATKTMVT